MIIKPNIEIVRKEVDSSHYYWVNGEFMPSVTHILDQSAPTPWALKNFFLNNTPESAEDIKNTAGNFGTLLHDAYEQLILGNEVFLKDDYKSLKAKKHLASFARWFAEFQPVNAQAEQTVASLKYRYAGTLDCLCEKFNVETGKNEIWLIDFKTSGGIYWSYHCQVVAYKQAVEETFGIKVDRMAILRTGTIHKCGYEFKEVTRSFQSFLNLYNTFVDINDGKIPEPPTMDIYPVSLKFDLKSNDEGVLK